MMLRRLQQIPSCILDNAASVLLVITWIPLKAFQTEGPLEFCALPANRPPSMTDSRQDSPKQWFKIHRINRHMEVGIGLARLDRAVGPPCFGIRSCMHKRQSMQDVWHFNDYCHNGALRKIYLAAAVKIASITASPCILASQLESRIRTTKSIVVPLSGICSCTI